MRKKKKNRRGTVKINREHKDKLFRLLFGNVKNKKNLLSLYNALNNTNYTNPDDLKITTIEDVIYMKMKNDISLLVEWVIALYEHQSTFNPNMPLRGLDYFAQLYAKYVEQNELNIYGTKRLELPTPQYIVFYNGEEAHEDVEELRLSDMFKKKVPGYEWTAIMININYGKNKELMEKCRPLQEYAIFIDKIRKHKKAGMTIEEAVDRAVVECIEEGILEEFLREHRAEVMNVFMTEYNEERVLDARWWEGYETCEEKSRIQIEEANARAKRCEEEKLKAEEEIAKLIKELEEFRKKVEDR